ncbi:related to CFT2-cleavage and polyadenylation specificity factor, part of CF II [Ramularia collo-cygni]|uniref:Cleavage and polyadenylation specificity factor subunit 2 n=1 Tax=Ramularia collo-cygni TaxID=112498 RepID=A0A2D3ULV0_9PEZI|nr:related to CFT2-cleavage and polyadenylation specificity factor, part of CF II [Ramularia collo-cygni]CZT14321.1 related to CFT2-cleavage and polyadenylation specificity factor, part of CF II [Ramularia collo-cygni]
MFHFTPLFGAHSASPASASLLELDGGVKILIDVGWDEQFSAEALDILGEHAPTISLLLLTHPTLDHIGAYSHCCKHIPHFSRIPVFATTPVINLGRTLLADLYASSTPAAATIPIGGQHVLFDAPTPEEITTHFNRIHPLKYSQPHQPQPAHSQPSLGHLTITAYSAGHTPGGTIWHVQHGLESIVYAADWNQARENLLSGAAWLGGAGGGAEIIEPLRRPTALICSSRGVEKTETQGRKKRDEVLIALIRETIAQGGKVLIPTDSSARVLELAFLLNQTWRENIPGPHADTYRHAKIYMASKTSSNTVRQLQGMLEWLDESIIRDAETAMGNHSADAQKVPTLLEWAHIKPMERKRQLERALRRSSPCIILASDASLEWGFSRLALQSLAGDARNLILLTENISPSSSNTSSSLSAQLADCWRNRSTSSSSTARVVGADGQTVHLKHHDLAPLSPEENVLYQQYLARQRALYTTIPDTDNTTLLPAEEAEEEDSSDDSEDENEGDHQGRALNLSSAILNQQGTKRKGGGLTDAELGVNILLQKRRVHDYDVRGKRGRERMFPFLRARGKADEFGEIVRPEDFLRAEEKVELDTVKPAAAPAAAPQQQQQGEKRKWGGAEKKGPEKKVKRESKREPDDIDALIARATGEGDSPKPGAPPTPNPDDDASSDSNADSESDYDPEDSDPTPHKLLTKPSTTLTLHARLASLDFEGLHDARDLQMLIPLIAPRKLILIKGTSRETERLARECRGILAEGSVMAPQEGERVDAGVDTNAWECRLGRGLVGKLRWADVKGLGVVAISGLLSAGQRSDEEEKRDTKRIKAASGEDGGNADEQEATPLLPILDLIPFTISDGGGGGIKKNSRRATQPVHVGDLRLADLRRSMQQSGFEAAFFGEGTLVVDGCVVVRKGKEGGIVEVEVCGGGGRAWEAVRGVVRGGLAVVEAGV